MMDNPDYKKIIRELMGDYRYEHSVNVADEAVTLAELYGGDVKKAYTAGILHDVTKELPNDKQLQIINDGSVYIQTELGITDSDIINAIRYHTTGRANMSLLEKIIYIADYTAKGRDYNGVEVMRELSRKSLEDAMIFSYQFTINKLSSLESAIHPDEIYGYNDIVLKRNRKE